MSAITRLDAIIDEFLRDASFRPEELYLDREATEGLVKYAGNPVRFLPKMFDGDWELRGRRPQVGDARVLRVMVDNGGVPRVILRQGPGLYIFTGVPRGEENP